MRSLKCEKCGSIVSIVWFTDFLVCEACSEHSAEQNKTIATKKERKIIQISAVENASGNTDTLTALCNDGSVWRSWSNERTKCSQEWYRLPDIPQDVVPEDTDG